MKYTITGGAGNISNELAKRLLQAGHEVTVISRDGAHLKELTHTGAKAATGSLEDVGFLKEAFAGADAVYTMYPSFFVSDDIKVWHENIANNYADAIRTNGIRYVVNLSSIGAHLPQGAGLVSGLHRAENVLNKLKDVNVKHLRPVYFYTNLVATIPLIHNLGIIGGNFSITENKFPVTHPVDVAAVAADELMHLSFSGHSTRYIASDETSTDEIAKVLGNAIGKPTLRWVRFSNEQALQGMLQSGMPEGLSYELVELFQAWDTGKITEEYWMNQPQTLGTTKLEDFAKVFAAIYNKK